MDREVSCRDIFKVGKRKELAVMCNGEALEGLEDWGGCDDVLGSIWFWRCCSLGLMVRGLLPTHCFK